MGGGSVGAQTGKAALSASSRVSWHHLAPLISCTTSPGQVPRRRQQSIASVGNTALAATTAAAAAAASGANLLCGLHAAQELLPMLQSDVRSLRHRLHRTRQGMTDADSRQVGKDGDVVRGAQRKVAKPIQPVLQTESLHLMGHRIRIAAVPEVPLAGHPAWAQATSHTIRSSADVSCKGSEVACQAACTPGSLSGRGAPGLSTAECALLRQQPAMQSMIHEGV